MSTGFELSRRRDNVRRPALKYFSRTLTRSLRPELMEVEMTDFPLITKILKGARTPLESLVFKVLTESGMGTLRLTADAARQLAAQISSVLPPQEASD